MRFLLLAALLSLPAAPHAQPDTSDTGGLAAQDSAATDSVDRSAPPRRDAAYSAPDSVSGQALASRLTGASGLITGYNDAWVPLSALNVGLGPAPTPPNLQTPQAALEHFVRAGRQEDYLDAARSLNLNLLPESEQALRAADYAERLFYVLDHQLGFDWEALSDRPDGTQPPAAGGGDPLAGQPRRSALLGHLTLDGRDVAVRLQRVRVGDEAPVWVFSPQTVENVPALYRRYGPGPVDRFMPEWAKVEVGGQTALWRWIALALAALVAWLIALGIRRGVAASLGRADADWARHLSKRVGAPVGTAVAVLLLFVFATAVLSLPGFVNALLLTLLIGALVWVAMRTVDTLAEWVARGDEEAVDSLSELSAGQQAERQRRLTYLSVGRRVLVLVVFLIGAGVLVAQFRSLEALGVSLIASASVGAVLLGIAAQPVLGNLVAGLQIALSKPVRIGDSVEFEGDWGFVEDVTFTYLLIQTWDKRRLVVPLRYFVTHPFENWTLRDAHLVKPILLRADYTLDVSKLRQKFDELVRAADAWDERKEPTVEVVDAGEETLEIRCLCSAQDPSTAWDLQCRLREELAAWLRDLDGGKHLPGQRVALPDTPFDPTAQSD